MDYDTGKYNHFDTSCLILQSRHYVPFFRLLAEVQIIR